MMPEHIIKDIGRKLHEDVSAAARRNILLVDDERAAFIVATYGASSAIAVAAGTLAAMTGETDGVKLADALWDCIRPMVVSAVGEIDHAD